MVEPVLPTEDMPIHDPQVAELVCIDREDGSEEGRGDDEGIRSSGCGGCGYFHSHGARPEGR